MQRVGWRASGAARACAQDEIRSSNRRVVVVGRRVAQNLITTAHAEPRYATAPGTRSAPGAHNDRTRRATLCDRAGRTQRRRRTQRNRTRRLEAQAQTAASSKSSATISSERMRASSVAALDAIMSSSTPVDSSRSASRPRTSSGVPIACRALRAAMKSSSICENSYASASSIDTGLASGLDASE